jgi:hypothetical protein
VRAVRVLDVVVAADDFTDGEVSGVGGQGHNVTDLYVVPEPSPVGDPPADGRGGVGPVTSSVLRTSSLLMLDTSPISSPPTLTNPLPRRDVEVKVSPRPEPERPAVRGWWPGWSSRAGYRARDCVAVQQGPVEAIHDGPKLAKILNQILTLDRVVMRESVAEVSEDSERLQRHTVMLAMYCRASSPISRSPKCLRSRS